VNEEDYFVIITIGWVGGVLLLLLCCCLFFVTIIVDQVEKGKLFFKKKGF